MATTKTKQPTITQLKSENTRLKNKIEDLEYKRLWEMKNSEDYHKNWLDYILADYKVEIRGYKQELQLFRRIQKYLEKTHCIKEDTEYGGTITKHDYVTESSEAKLPFQDDPLAELREYYRVMGVSEFKVCRKCGNTYPT